MTNLKDQVLEKLPNIASGKSLSKNKGWNSPKVVDKWLKDTLTLQELEGLEKTKSGIYSFDKAGQLTMLLS